jgi:hypothetical protein
MTATPGIGNIDRILTRRSEVFPSMSGISMSGRTTAIRVSWDIGRNASFQFKVVPKQVPTEVSIVRPHGAPLNAMDRAWMACSFEVIPPT